MSKQVMSESELVEVFIESNFIKKSLLIEEVPVNSRCVDLVIYNKNRNAVSAVEFKTRHWKAAIAQAVRVAASFDYIEICIIEPQRKSCKEEVMQKCIEQGIGLYFVNQDKRKVKRIVKPKKMSMQWKIQKKRVVEYLCGRLAEYE